MNQFPNNSSLSADQQYSVSINRAQTLIDVQKYDNALQEVRTALTASPDSGYAHYLASHCCYHLGNYRESRTEAKQSISLNPFFASAYEMMALIALRENRFPDGLKDIDKALELDSENAHFLRTRSVLLLNSSRHKEALQTAEESLRIDPNNSHGQHLRGIALSNLGKHAQSGAQANDLLRKSPNNALAWYNQGVHLMYTGKLDEAQMALRESLRIDPESEHAQNALMQVVSTKHLFFGLLWRWTLFLHKFPTSVRLLIIVGIIMITHVSPTLRSLWMLFCLYMIVSRPLFYKAVQKGWIK